MGNEISQQLTSFLASGLLGAVLGLLYDLLRSFRQAVRGRGVSLFDGLYSLFAFAAVFYFTMTFGEGELRLCCSSRSSARRCARCGISGVAAWRSGCACACCRWALPCGRAKKLENGQKNTFFFSGSGLQ